jgi:hypothetical protein
MVAAGGFVVSLAQPGEHDAVGDTHRSEKGLGKFRTRYRPFNAIWRDASYSTR